MATIKQVTTQIEDLAVFGDLTQLYSEVAFGRLWRVREAVLANRRFLNELDAVFTQVQAAYLKKVELTRQGRSVFGGKVSVLQHNGVNVHVLIAANTRLYGDILKRTYQEFMKGLAQTGGEATVVGRVGLTMWRDERGRESVTSFEFPDDKVDRGLLGKIIEHLVQYESVTLYYPKFKNVLIQEPADLLVSALKPNPALSGNEIRPYHFEPSLEAVMAFFEKEIFAINIEQAVRESQLAKFAARALAMDRASEAIENQSGQARQRKRVMARDERNKAQLNIAPAYLTLNS